MTTDTSYRITLFSFHAVSRPAIGSLGGNRERQEKPLTHDHRSRGLDVQIEFER